MNGSSFGNYFKITTFGESHGAALGVIVDGCPAGIPLSAEYIQTFLDRRKPGQNIYSTPRKESDLVEILSGVFEGKTTGTSIALLIRNESQRSGDYSEIASYYRPGHADFTFDAKYGFRDYRGGGRSSGRETAARVAAGAIACALLNELGIQVCAYAKSIHSNVCFDTKDYLAERYSIDELVTMRDQSPLNMPDAEASAKAEAFLNKMREEHNSVGGTIECVLTGLPAGLGDPVFEKFDARLAHAMLSMGAVKGFEIGSGFDAALLTGTEQNDAFFTAENGCIKKRTNRAGGVLGGMTDGSDVLFRVAVKPTPSVYAPQETVKKDGSSYTCQITGRHDPIIVSRAVVVVECMAALTAADALLSNLGSKLEHLKKIYARETTS
ncbi:MAG: chorismate synthase [Lachnospiraceae bacterium]|nr:chorismate synthase [Lachnospiraceae bacterium]